MGCILSFFVKKIRSQYGTQGGVEDGETKIELKSSE